MKHFYIINLVTSILMPTGLIAGSVHWYYGNILGLIWLIGGLISIPIWIWNVRKARHGN